MHRRFEELAASGEVAVRALWRSGTAPAPEELAGWIFRGWNTARAVQRSPLAGAAFAKAFFWSGNTLHGCNFPVTVRDGDWRLEIGQPFGFFAVYPTAEAATWAALPSGLLLDYGRGRGAEFLATWGVRLRPRLRLAARLARPLRDVVVRPSQAADGLYVGRAFVTTTLKLPVTCFVLERWRQLGTVPALSPALAGVSEPAP